jgi:hypothetical protein
MGPAESLLGTILLWLLSCSCWHYPNEINYLCKMRYKAGISFATCSSTLPTSKTKVELKVIAIRSSKPQSAQILMGDKKRY